MFKTAVNRNIRQKTLKLTNQTIKKLSQIVI